MPGFSRFELDHVHHRQWVTLGLDLSRRQYDSLLEAIARSQSRVGVFCNPSAYEI